MPLQALCLPRLYDRENKIGNIVAETSSRIE
jgi:hypothetical protein